MNVEQEFLKMLNKSGLTSWHNRGFKGKGIKVLCCQDVKHGTMIRKVFGPCAPESTLIFGSPSLTFRNGVMVSNTIVVDGITYNFEDYAIKGGFNLIFCSSAAANATNQNAEWTASCKRIQDRTGAIFNNSAGNKGENKKGEALAFRFPSKHTLLWGSMGISDTGVPKKLNSCLTGADLDFMAFAPLAGGTSAACPFGTGMEAVIMSKEGIMSLKDMTEYLIKISVSLNLPGCGYGRPVLPQI